MAAHAAGPGPQNLEEELRGLIGVLQSQVERIAARLDSTDQYNIQIIADVRAQMQSIAAGAMTRSPKEIRLLSDKDIKPGFFNGGPKEDFKEWAKKTKMFLNLKCDTFRAVLTWAEQQKDQITDEDVDLLDWRDRREGDTKLHDYLCSVLDLEPLTIAERTPGKGLEAWRRLNKRFDPHGGQHDMDRYEALVYNVKKARNLQDLPKIIEMWEKELETFTSRTSDYPIHDSLKTCVMLKMVPDDYARELKFKYNATKQEFDVLRDNIMEFCSINAPPKVYNGPKAMDISPFDKQREEQMEKWTAEEWAEWVFDEQNPTSELDYLGKPRKGKGKGKGGKVKGKGKGKETREPRARVVWDAAKIKQYEENRCFICDETGHQASKCPKNPAKDLKGFEEEAQQDRAVGLGAQLDAGSFDREMSGIQGDVDSLETEESNSISVGDDLELSPLSIDLSYDHEGRQYDGKAINRMHTAMSQKMIEHKQEQQNEFQSPPARTHTGSPSTLSPTAEMFRIEMEEAMLASRRPTAQTLTSQDATPERVEHISMIAEPAKEEFVDLLGEMFEGNKEEEEGFQQVQSKKWKRRRPISMPSIPMYGKSSLDPTTTTTTMTHSFYDPASVDFDHSSDASGCGTQEFVTRGHHPSAVHTVETQTAISLPTTIWCTWTATTTQEVWIDEVTVVEMREGQPGAKERSEPPMREGQPGAKERSEPPREPQTELDRATSRISQTELDRATSRILLHLRPEALCEEAVPKGGCGDGSLTRGADHAPPDPKPEVLCKEAAPEVGPGDGRLVKGAHDHPSGSCMELPPTTDEDRQMSDYDSLLKSFIDELNHVPAEDMVEISVSSDDDYETVTDGSLTGIAVDASTLEKSVTEYAVEVEVAKGERVEGLNALADAAISNNED